MVTHPTRRRLLQLSGVGVTTSLAGCSQFDVPGAQDQEQNQTDSETELDADPEPDIDPADGITALVQPDQEASQELQQEVMSEVQAGELDQQEAQAEFQRRQAELIATRAAEFESTVADDDDLSIEAGIAEQGAFLLDGSDERLLDTLRNGEVSGLIPGEEYGQLLEQRQQQQQQQDQPANESEETESTDGNETDADGGNETDADSDSDSDANSTDGNETDS